MLTEAFDWLVAKARPELVQYKAKTFSTEKLNPLTPSMPKSVHLNSLDGLCDFIRTNIDSNDMDEMFIKIADHGNVQLLGSVDEVWKIRPEIVHVDLSLYPDGFEFGRWKTQEQFIIGLQSNFQEGGDLKKLMKLVGTMRAEKINGSADDGITQKVVTKSGVMLVEESECPNPVELLPYRTFRELPNQPASKFVFRVTQNADEMPKCALYEADGGEWKLDAMKMIQDYLDGRNLDIDVIC